eukprot:m.100548 g.100548  ORF g.100548 m.100548 type:complete len:176 (+) comp27253_c1_seq1:1261-1788(+)
MNIKLPGASVKVPSTQSRYKSLGKIKMETSVYQYLDFKPGMLKKKVEEKDEEEEEEDELPAIPNQKNSNKRKRSKKDKEVLKISLFKAEQAAQGLPPDNPVHPSQIVTDQGAEKTIPKWRVQQLKQREDELADYYKDIGKTRGAQRIAERNNTRKRHKAEETAVATALIESVLSL